MNKVIHIRGDTFTRSWLIKDESLSAIDLTGCAVRFQARDLDGVLVISSSVEDGGITLDAIAGRIYLKVSKTAMQIDAGSYNFDLEATYPDDTRITYEQGILIILQDYAYG